MKIQTQVGGVLIHGRLGIQQAPSILGTISQHMIKSGMETCTVPAHENNGMTLYLTKKNRTEVIGQVVGHHFVGTVCETGGTDMPVEYFIPLLPAGNTNFEKPWVKRGDGEFNNLAEFKSGTKSGTF
jgi:hypothetical protein